jgi:hypothetical protein
MEMKIMKRKAVFCVTLALMASSVACKTEKSSAPPTEQAVAPSQPTGGVAAPSQPTGGVAAPSTPPTVTGDRIQLKVVEGRGGLDSEIGFVKIAGEVHNTSSQWVTTPRIDVQLFDASGKKLDVTSIAIAAAQDTGAHGADDFVYAELGYVPPGEIAIFKYTRDANKFKGTYSSHKLVASALPVSAAPSVSLKDMSIQKDQDDKYTATGAIENDGKMPCYSPAVVFGFYAQDGKLCDVKKESIEPLFQKNLDPGKKADFKFTMYPPSGETVGEVKGWASCERVD